MAGAAVVLGASGLAEGPPPASTLLLDDASRRNATPVFRHWVVTPDPEVDFIARLRAELNDASAAGRPVAVGAARHSLGGQTLPLHGTAITLDRGRCEPNTGDGTYRVFGGARWRDVIATLDPVGWSPKVMQSNNDFGVAASVSVNAHGWPVPFGPVGTTVRSLRLMLADGTIVTCSRSENAELFSHVIGGYGLFGVILDLVVEMVPNVFLSATPTLLPAKEAGGRFAELVTTDADIRMAYGRLSLDRARFLEVAEIVSFRACPTPRGGLPPATSGGLLYGLARTLYRAQIGSDMAKRARWFAETVVGPDLAPAGFSRNRLINEPIAHLAGGPADRTDILHEYFVAPDRLGAFLSACRILIPRSGAELINVTLRYIAADTLSALPYAPEPRMGAVMLFSQAAGADAEAGMMRLTQDLVDHVLALGGSFYLPYRPHARPTQVVQAYPTLARVTAAKRLVDPKLVIRNHFWDTYMAGLA